ncbi:hypothetical protein [Mesobacillus foraminis]|nr:hypothetical protein [Mesobacillus foraminis]
MSFFIRVLEVLLEISIVGMISDDVFARIGKGMKNALAPISKIEAV